MNKIKYPLLFEPLLQENVWGGEYLKTRSSNVPTGVVGESWEISDYRSEVTCIKNGEYRGKVLHDVLDGIYSGNDIPERYPLLLKILAPESELSVQVHPNDDYTASHSLNDSGKAEAWYILDAPRDSFIYLGLPEKLDKKTIKHAIEDGTLTKYLNKVYVKNGDVVNIPHGTIHSLCPNIKVFEIQQSSNITYRLFDWGRVDKDGNSRQLHIEEALDVINFDYLPRSHLVTPVTLTESPYLREKYIESTNFTMEKFSNLTSPITLENSNEKVYIITSINSTLEVNTDWGSVTLGKYDSCMIPAFSGNFTISGSMNSDFLLFC